MLNHWAMQAPHEICPWWTSTAIQVSEVAKNTYKYMYPYNSIYLLLLIMVTINIASFIKKLRHYFSYEVYLILSFWPTEPCALLGHESYILICATSSPGLWIPHRLELVYPCMSRIQEKLIIVSLFYQISTLIQPFSLVILKQKGKKLFFFFFLEKTIS